MTKHLSSFILVIFFILYSQFSFAQKDFEKNLINNEVTINYPDSTVFAQLYAGEKTIKPIQDRLYLWYRANDIKQTRGGIDGKALDGNYIVYYHDKNLKEKGFTKKGLRTGKWLRWYHNGEIQEFVNWKKGLKNGKFSTYNEAGKIILKGKYWKGKLHGMLYTYDSNGKFTIKIYKKDVFIKDVEVVEKEVKSEKVKEKKVEANNTNNASTNPFNTTPSAPVKKTWKEKLASPFVWIKSKFKSKKAAETPKAIPFQ